MTPSVVGTALLLAGCMGAESITGISSDYPGNWPPFTRQSDGCPDISGRFSPVGVSSRGRISSDYQPAVNEFLATHFFGFLIDTREVQVSQPTPDVLAVKVLYGKDLVASRELLASAGDFECDEEGLWVRIQTKSRADAIGAFRAETRLGLIKAADGSLIGQRRVSSAGALLWTIPIGGQQIQWFRWSQAQTGQ